MSKQPYSPQLLKEYLLGVLREQEAERLDERSLTDDAFVEALAAAEKDLVDAYVQNELTSDELEKFRSHYLNSRLRRQRAQFAEALKTMMERESIQYRITPSQTVEDIPTRQDRKSTRLNSSHGYISYAVFCLKKKIKKKKNK